MLQTRQKPLKAIFQLQSHVQKIQLYPKNLNNLSKNEQTLIQGVKNYNQVMENNCANLYKNSFVQHKFEPLTDAVNSLDTMSPNIRNRPHVHVYHKLKSAMHQNPYNFVSGEHWFVQAERSHTMKTNSMGWNYVNDSFSKRQISFTTLEDAVEFCTKMGFSFDVSKPHFRYIQKKNYGDRMKWKGFPTESEDC